MNRRDFLKYAWISAGALGLGGTFFLKARAPGLLAETTDVNLSVISAEDEMIDGRRIFVRAFIDNDAPVKPDGFRLTHVPGPVLQAFHGDMVHVLVKNELGEPHSFVIPGVVDSGAIAPHATWESDFAAPPPGTYMYMDTLDAPVNRLLGLHGAFVVNQRLDAPENDSPYLDAQLTDSVRSLFADLGANKDVFPHGQPWNRERQMIWLFQDIDPALNDSAAGGRVVFDKETYLPRYFVMNGRSAPDSVHAEDTVIRGKLGQPMLVRMLNAGLACVHPHLHGNHYYVLSKNAVVLDNVLERDTVRLSDRDDDVPDDALQPDRDVTTVSGYRIDILVPFKLPPDIPDEAWPPREELTAEPFARHHQEKGVLDYPMHPHNELTQTAAGGLYPKGALADMVIDIRDELGI